MDVNEYLRFRKEIIENSIDEDDVFSEESFLSDVLPDLLETKLIDSEDLVFSYLNMDIDGSILKNNAHLFNETGERLQLFIIDEKNTRIRTQDEDVIIKEKKYYENIFNKSIRFIKKSIKRHLELQDSDPANFLVSKLGNAEFIDSIDTIEIFLISPSVTVETRGKELELKRMFFKDEEYNVRFSIDRKIKEKEILITKQLIDLNYLYDISVSKGYKHELIIDIENVFKKKIEVLKAADEMNFETYLCILPAEGIASLYRKYSTRLLEKNVRSFLQFRGVNKGMRDTIKYQPERFIAYNNGLTITSSDKVITEEKDKLFLKELNDFQIVNGGQTTASIFFSKKAGLDISGINVMAKINIAKNLNEKELNELISNISLYSNSQNKVNNVDKKTSDPKINKIKALSNSIMTPNGNKWFFEKLRGEFKTKILLKGGNRKRVEREYPKERRLTKTEIGKYYTAWGDQPWLVKKGGEKVFGYFLTHISEGVTIDRKFYEELIAKAIIFRKLERIHGVRKNAIGQLRSAIVPYTISVLFMFFKGSEKRNAKFDLQRIWKDQNLDKDLEFFLLKLMRLMYNLVEKYKTSDDISENTKKSELWVKIKKSKEIEKFLLTEDAYKIYKKYKSLDNKKRKNESFVDFTILSNIIDLHSKSINYYKEIDEKLNNKTNSLDFRSEYFDNILTKLFPANNIGIGMISESEIKFIIDLLKKIQEDFPNLINSTNFKEDNRYLDTLSQIIKIYNEALTRNEDVFDAFNKYEQIAIYNKIKYTGSISKIGKQLKENKSPELSDLFYASYYFYDFKSNGLKNKSNKTQSTLNNLILKGDIYIKKISKQDIERTPSVSKEAAKYFFNLTGTEREIFLNYNNQIYSYKLSKRETRDEYRFYIRSLRNKLIYYPEDFLIFIKMSEIYDVQLIRKNDMSYSEVLNKLDGKSHLIMKRPV